MYEEHFLLNTDTIKDYVKEKLDYFSPEAKLEVKEIGDGNINYVFKIVDLNTGKSLVIKQADKYLRSSGRPLDLHRNKIEATILKMEGQLAPSMVPEVFDYNEVMCALAMEDISAYKNLRTELLAGKVFPHMADDISTFLADTLLPTTDLVRDRHEKKKDVQLFTNIDLCDISEDLVFTEPYWDYKGRNILTKGTESFVKSELYEDSHLHAEVAYLRDRFMNYAQSLIHGDLHSGSIFVNEKGIKVIDPEFAFYGPAGYDIGNVIGNLFFALVHLELVQKKPIDWLEECIQQIFDLTQKKLSQKYDELIKFPLYKTQKFKEQYLENMMEDALGYAGTEIIRRTVGDSKVLEVQSIQDASLRIVVDKTLIQIGKNLICQRQQLKVGKDIIDMSRRVIRNGTN